MYKTNTEFACPTLRHLQRYLEVLRNLAFSKCYINHKLALGKRKVTLRQSGTLQEASVSQYNITVDLMLW